MLRKNLNCTKISKVKNVPLLLSPALQTATSPQVGRSSHIQERRVWVRIYDEGSDGRGVLEVCLVFHSILS